VPRESSETVRPLRPSGRSRIAVAFVVVVT
jgi:hypothetical protein